MEMMRRDSLDSTLSVLDLAHGLPGSRYALGLATRWTCFENFPLAAFYALAS